MNVYFEDEPGSRPAAKVFSKDEAWRIAMNVARLCLTRLVHGALAVDAACRFDHRKRPVPRVCASTAHTAIEDRERVGTT